MSAACRWAATVVRRPASANSPSARACCGSLVPRGQVGRQREEVVERSGVCREVITGLHVDETHSTHQTATQGLRFVLSGVFDANPNLKIILGHMGEGLPFLLWRISHGLRATMKEKTFRTRQRSCVSKRHRQQTLRLLKDSDREVLWMRHHDSLSAREAGLVLGVDANAAQVRYVRALRRVDKISLLAWSLGGPRSGGYAALHPEKISKLVWLAPAYQRNGARVILPHF